MPAIKTERRFLFERANVRMADASENTNAPGILEGYAAVFYRENDPQTEFDLFEGEILERIDPGAFSDIAGDDIRCLFDHHSRSILGRNTSGTLELKVDQIGLFYRCKLPNTSAGRDVAESLNRGDITGSSFQFDILDQEWNETEGQPTIRTLKKLKLFDVGPVTFPAYEATSAGIRGIERAREELASIVRQKRNTLRRMKRLQIAHQQAHRNGGG